MYSPDSILQDSNQPYLSDIYQNNTLHPKASDMMDQFNIEQPQALEAWLLGQCF